MVDDAEAPEEVLHAMTASEATPESTNGEPIKTTSSVHDYYTDKPPFGSRYLTADSDVWSKNAWDHVPPPSDQGDKIAASLARQKARPVPVSDKSRYNEKPARHWDNFYKMNADNFFRNRKWLHTEFPELVAAAEPDAGTMTVVELGCGAGNSVFPLLSSNKNADLRIHAYDYSSHAVKLVQNNPLYLNPPIGTIQASVWDITSSTALPPDLAPQSADIVILIFVLSALHPDEWAQALKNVHNILKSGGLVVLRDYGRHDLTQLRFKDGRLLDDNFYIRGDKTRVYFFDLDELAMLFTGSASVPMHNLSQAPIVEYDDESKEDDSSGRSDRLPSGSVRSTPPGKTMHPECELTPDDSTADVQLIGSAALTSSAQSGHGPGLAPPPPSSPDSVSTFATTAASRLPHPLFTIEQLGVDRRMLLNRKRQLKMYRVWMQGKFRKL